MGKRLGQSKQDGALVDGKSFVLNTLKCFGISQLSVSKVEVLEGSMHQQQPWFPSETPRCSGRL
jgi:hypothetical protein